jgi:hypothetical protein
MTPERTFGKLLGLRKSWRVLTAGFAAEYSKFFLKVRKTPDLWPEESARAGTPVTSHDHVELMQSRHLNLLSNECVILCALTRGRRSTDRNVYRVHPPWEVPQQALRPGVRSLGSDPHARDASEACWLAPWRELHPDVADALRTREGGACAVDFRQRGAGGS